MLVSRIRTCGTASAHRGAKTGLARGPARPLVPVGLPVRDGLHGRSSSSTYIRRAGMRDEGGWLSPGYLFLAFDARPSAFVRSIQARPCPASVPAAMIVSVSSFIGRVQRNLEWADQARGRQGPRSPSRNGYACFFPLPRRDGIPRGRQKSRLLAVLR